MFSTVRTQNNKWNDFKSEDIFIIYVTCQTRKKYCHVLFLFIHLINFFERRDIKNDKL